MLQLEVVANLDEKVVSKLVRQAEIDEVCYEAGKLIENKVLLVL